MIVMIVGFLEPMKAEATAWFFVSPLPYSFSSAYSRVQENCIY